MKKLIALIGLTGIAFYFFYQAPLDTDIFIDEIKTKKAAVKQIKITLPKKIVKNTKKHTKEPTREEIIGKILESTSTSHSLKSIDYIIDDRLKQAQTYLSPEQYAKLENVLKTHFDGEKIVKRITKHLAKNLSQRELEELKEGIQDPFLNKVWSLEEYANSSEGMEAFDEYLVESQNDVLDQERITIIKQFDEEVGGTDSVIELNSALVKGILEGSNLNMPPDQKLRPRDIKKMTAILADQIRANIDTKVVKNMLFTYQDLTNEDIVELKNKSANGAFAKTSELIGEELKEILLEGGREIGKSNVHLN